MGVNPLDNGHYPIDFLGRINCRHTGDRRFPADVENVRALGDEGIRKLRRDSSEANRPASEKDSGLALTTPMTRVVSM
jgi:hypothetical protein